MEVGEVVGMRLRRDKDTYVQYLITDSAALASNYAMIPAQPTR